MRRPPIPSEKTLRGFDLSSVIYLLKAKFSGRSLADRGSVRAVASRSDMATAGYTVTLRTKRGSSRLSGDERS